MRISFLKFIILGEAASRNLGFRRSATLGIAAICAATGLTAVADTQQIPLVVGTNSIAFQLVPTNAQPAAVFGTLGAAFIEAWTFNNATKQWSFFRNPSLPEAGNANGLAGLAMGPIVPGQGYLVRMATAGSSLTVSGNPPAFNTIPIYPGMNFLGFPVPANAPGTIGLQDILNGPTFSLSTAFSWDPFRSLFLSFTGNGLSDDGTFLFEKNKGLWVESSSPTVQLWTLDLAQPPLVYIERGNSYVIEAPIGGAGGTTVVNVPVRLTRPYSGMINFVVSGTAHPDTDFAIRSSSPVIGPQNSVGGINISAPNLSFAIPVAILEKPRLQTNSSVVITLRRPVETSAVQDSATLPQVAHIKITDGINGVFDGFLRGAAAGGPINGHKMRVALRANGQAVFEPEEGGMISSRFSLPYTITNGVPQLNGSANVPLATSGALKRIVTLGVTPAATIPLDGPNAVTPAFDVPLTLTFTNLTGSGPYQVAAKITLTQADPAQVPAP